jgi:alkylation response protein AidB-like acyl-CoA dehydrogenase
MMSRNVLEANPADAGEKLVERARAVAPVLAANAETTEQALRPAPESIAAVREAGLFGLTVPAEFGGLAATSRTRVLVMAELGRACPSTAWVTALSTGTKQMFSSMLPEQAVADLFADPDVIVCSSSVSAGGTGAETGEGLRISGRWRFASGCEDATWAILITPVIVDGQPVRMSAALVPRIDLVVERDWRAAGMAGTGSHSLVAADVLVPAGRALAPVAPEQLGQRFDFSSQVRGLTDTLALFCGAARGALDVVEAAFAGNRAPHGTTYQRMVQSPLARHWFAEATQLVDTAAARALSNADALDALDADAAFPINERARLRMELVTGAAECRAAVEKLLDLHGLSGFAPENPLQRFWRDIAVGTRHPQLNRYITAEDYGRVLLDAESPVTTML